MKRLERDKTCRNNAKQKGFIRHLICEEDNIVSLTSYIFESKTLYYLLSYQLNNDDSSTSRLKISKN